MSKSNFIFFFTGFGRSGRRGLDEFAGRAESMKTGHVIAYGETNFSLSSPSILVRLERFKRHLIVLLPDLKAQEVVVLYRRTGRRTETKSILVRGNKVSARTMSPRPYSNNIGRNHVAIPVSSL